MYATIVALESTGSTEAKIIAEVLTQAQRIMRDYRQKDLDQDAAISIAERFEEWAKFARHEVSERDDDEVIDDLMNRGKRSAEATAIADAMAEGASLNEIVDWAQFTKKKLKGGGFEAMEEIADWVRNLVDRAKLARDHQDFSEMRIPLIEFFRMLGFEHEFDRAWQFDVFDAWIRRPTERELYRLIDVVKKGMM